MKQLIFLTLAGICINIGVNGQNWEGGLQSGVSNYRGDLAPYLVPSESHPFIGIYFKRNLSQFFAFNLALNQGKISGDDGNFKQLENRNLDFESQITELSATFEFNFFPFLKGLHPNQFTPFVFSGLGIFRFNPKTDYKGKTYELAKLNTEGQTVTEGGPNDYSLIQPSMPIGGGIKARFANRLNVGLKVGYRMTFFDHLDDVSTNYPSQEALAKKQSSLSANLSNRSKDENAYAGAEKQRGNPQNNDWYFFAGITISYYIENPICYDFH